MVMIVRTLFVLANRVARNILPRMFECAIIARKIVLIPAVFDIVFFPTPLGRDRCWMEDLSETDRLADRCSGDGDAFSRYLRCARMCMGV